MNTFETIYLIVKQIPYGKVSTYGDIAKRANITSARVVGYALSSCKEDVPWQRVVNRLGEISDRNAIIPTPQKEILISEGVIFDNNNRID